MTNQDRVNYDSISEVHDHPEPTNPDNLSEWKRVTTDSYGGSGWFGPKGTKIQDVYNYAEKGWQAGAKKVEKLSESISLPVLESIHRKLVKGDIGDFLDPHAINRGQFSTAWTSKKRKAGRGPKRYQLCCQIGGHFGMSGDALMWRGVACLALAQAIIKAGHAVEIIAYANVSGCYTDGSGLVTTVKVKPFQSYLDLSSLAVVLGLSGFYRVYMWKARLCSDKTIEDGFGCPSGSLPKIESGTAKQIKIYEDATSKESAENFLKNVIKEL